MTEQSRTKEKGWNDLPTSLNHHTITTDNTRKSPRSEVTPSQALDEHVMRLLAGDSNIPGFESYSSVGKNVDGGLSVDVWRSGTHIVTFIVCPENNAASSALFDELKLFAMHARTSREPTAPFCSAAIHAGALLFPTSLMWIADYERCVAWTWLHMNMTDRRHEF